MTDREKLLAKIRALLAKKIDQGCTEEEALAALAICALAGLNDPYVHADHVGSPALNRQQFSQPGFETFLTTPIP